MFVIAQGFAVIGKVVFFLCLDFDLLPSTSHFFLIVIFVSLISFNFDLSLLSTIALDFHFLIVVVILKILFFYFLQLIFIIATKFQINLLFSY